MTFFAGFTVLIPDYFRGQTAAKHFMTSTLPKFVALGMFVKQQTKWEKLES